MLRCKVTKYPDMQIESAGLAALVGRKADATVRRLMRARDINISEHRARQLNSKLIRDADLVLVMEKNHIKITHKISPFSKGRVHLLGKWGKFEIPDPYKRHQGDFEMTLELIERGVYEWEDKV